MNSRQAAPGLENPKTENFSPVHLAFVDFISWDYTIDAAYQRPLGGSQSALCYLAEQLAARGHTVQLINNTAMPGASRGVNHPLAFLQS